MTSGILNVDKPAGATSFDVVRMVRRGTGEKRVGHAGTLDPAATGVLLVLLGQATRVTEYLMELPKTYRATVRLGISTTTYDAEGEVTREVLVDVSEEQLRAALSEFVGEIEQVPPAHSAVKVDGERAYKLARRGEAVALKARRAVVYRIELLSYEPPDAVIEVECGRGTYIRSLAHDVGERLGCGAHLAALERTRVGPFSVEAAADEGTLGRAFDSGEWRELLQPLDCGLLALPALTLGIEDEKDIRHGQAVTLEEETVRGLPEVRDGLEARGYAEDGSLVGIVRYDAATGTWRPRKVFATSAG
jgi:tRNA pseudouridine55 synthase